jgi:enterobactin synthetase component D
LGASERRTIGSQKKLPPATLSTIVFSSKEALFKALYPTVRAYFDFGQVEFVGITAGDRIALRLGAPLHETLPAGTCFEVQYRRFSEHVLTWLRVRIEGVPTFQR